MKFFLQILHLNHVFLFVFSLFISNFSSASSANVIPVECTFPQLKLRLIRMILINEPEAFEIIIHSECRKYLNVLHSDYLDVFKYLLVSSDTRNVNKFFKIIMKSSAYSPLMFNTWINHRPLLKIEALKVLKYHFKHPESTLIFSIKQEYPQTESQEHQLLANWLVSIQSPALNWPFPPSPKRRADSSKIKSKSFSTSSNAKLNEIETVKVVNNLDVETTLDTITDLAVKAAETVDVSPIDILVDFGDGAVVKSSESNTVKYTNNITNNTIDCGSALNFGHIYGWVSRKNNPIVRNSPDLFHFCGHSVKLQNNFLGFSSPKFNLNDYADSSKSSSRSFFDKPNSALNQKIRQSESNKNFSACRLHQNNNNNLQVILKGNLMLVVLSRLSDGAYDFKYPDNPYLELLTSTEAIKSFSIPISPLDIVLFLPRTLFTDSEFKISPHDIAGSFHHTDLGSFAGMFVNFINFVHLKTEHHGLIAVGGFVHTRNQANEQKQGQAQKIK